MTTLSITAEPLKNYYGLCLLMQVMENEGEILALKLVSGQYAYSMEATCPKGG